MLARGEKLYKVLVLSYVRQKEMKWKGYSFDRMDPGGETYMGISRVYWPGWKGGGLLTGL